MGRLTKVDGIGQNEIIKCFGCDLERAGAELEHCGYCEHWQAVVDRLAAYEDTGLASEDIKAAFNEEAVLKLAAQALGTTPDRLQELVKAQDEGLVVVLRGDHTESDGEEALRTAMYHCGVTNNPVTRYTADAIAEKLICAKAEAALSSQEGGPHEIDPV